MIAKYYDAKVQLNESEFHAVYTDGVYRILAALPPRPDRGGFMSFSAARPELMKDPSAYREFDMTNSQVKVKDQGQHGSCFPSGAKVLLGNGEERRIEDVQLLDVVMTAEGRLATVTQLLKRHLTEGLVTLKFAGCRSLTLTPCHPVYTMRGYIRAIDLTEFDYVGSPRFVASERWHGHVVEVPVFDVRGGFNLRGQNGFFADVPRDLDAGTATYTRTHLWYRVLEKSASVYTEPVYNLSVSRDESYVVEGHGVHNCVGHGAYGGFTEAWLQAGNPYIDFSPCYVYGMGNGNRDQGMVVSDAMQILIDHGICLESEVPEGMIYKSQFPSSAQTTAARFKVREAYACRTSEEIFSAVQASFNVVYGIMVGAHFVDLDGEGVPGVGGNGGHCYVGGTMISALVPRPIEDVGTGDEVFGHDGRLHAVTGTSMRHYTGSLFSIRGANNIPFRVTDEHPLLIYRPQKQYAREPAWTDRDLRDQVHRIEDNPVGTEGIPTWVVARDLRVGDYLLSPVVEYPEGCSLPSWLRSQGDAQPHDLTAPSDDVAWMMGYYIANGGLDSEKSVAFTVPIGKMWVVDKLLAVWAGLGIEARLKKPDGPDDQYRRVRVFSKTVHDSFAAWFGDGSLTKHIPPFLFSGWNLKRLVAGITDGDGVKIPSKSNPLGEGINTISPVLARQLWHIDLTRGRHASLTPVSPNRPGAYANAQPGYRVEFRYDPTNPHSKFWGKFYAMPVRRITEIAYSGPVYNCEVEGVNSYLAEGCATHNCMCSGNAMKKSSKWGWLVKNRNSWSEKYGINGFSWLGKAHFEYGGMLDAFAIKTVRHDPQEA